MVKRNRKVAVQEEVLQQSEWPMLSFPQRGPKCFMNENRDTISWENATLFLVTSLIPRIPVPTCQKYISMSTCSTCMHAHIYHCKNKFVDLTMEWLTWLQPSWETELMSWAKEHPKLEVLSETPTSYNCLKQCGIQSALLALTRSFCNIC